MLRFMTAGESHGRALAAIVEGFPAGLVIDEDFLNVDLARRQKGYGRGGRMKIESDRIEVISGVRFGETTGAPITITVKNKDWENWTDRMAAFGKPAGEKVTAARPGHADYPGSVKYARDDARDILERSSARETTMRVAVGAIAKAFLSNFGVKISSEIIELGGVKIDPGNSSESVPANSELNCRDAAAEKKMKEKIDAAKEAGDTLGGVFQVCATGLPIGLGSHIQWDRRLDGRLAGAFMSIQAIKGVEIGAGFEVAHLPGSEVHDEMFYENGKIVRKTNRAGGLEGGMTNGEPVIIRAAMKPIPTLMKPLRSVDIATHEPILASKERSDVCALPAAAVVGEAMCAIVLADAMLEKFGGDAIVDMKAAVEAYRQRVGLRNII